MEIVHVLKNGQTVPSIAGKKVIVPADLLQKEQIKTKSEGSAKKSG